MLQFLSKENDVGSTLLKYLQLRKDYHENIARQISEQMEHFQTLLNSPTVASPIYGCALDEHLKKHGGYVALPIRTCVQDEIRVLKIFSSSSLMIIDEVIRTKFSCLK